MLKGEINMKDDNIERRNYTGILKCPECGSSDITNENDEIYCKNCGLVLSGESLEQFWINMEKVYGFDKFDCSDRGDKCGLFGEYGDKI